MVAALSLLASTMRSRTLPLAPPRAGAGEIGRHGALELVFRERPGMAQQAQSRTVVGHDRAATRGVALAAGQRCRTMASPTIL